MANDPRFLTRLRVMANYLLEILAEEAGGPGNAVYIRCRASMALSALEPKLAAAERAACTLDPCPRHGTGGEGGEDKDAAASIGLERRITELFEAVRALAPHGKSFSSAVEKERRLRTTIMTSARERSHTTL